MHAFLITGAQPERRLSEAKARIGQRSSGVDLIIIENPKGIDSAREIKSALTRRPYQSQAITIILSEAQTLTIEAQNALLKTLEEPPGQAHLYITAPTTGTFLPTVLSRLHTFDLGSLQNETNDSELKKAFSLWQEGSLTKLFDATDTDLDIWAILARALLFYKLNAEDQATTIILSKATLQPLADQLEANDLKLFLVKIQQTASLLGSNTNRKLAMENLFLSLPKPSKKD